MSLARRIERLENAVNEKHEGLPDMVISFVDAVQGADGQMRPGRCVGRILSPAFGNSLPRPYGEPLWIDDDGNAIPPPEWTKEKIS